MTLNRAVTVAKVHGPQAVPRELAWAEGDPGLRGHHGVDAVRAHLLEMPDDRHAAAATYLRAARRTRSVPEQRYLCSRAAQLERPGLGNPAVTAL